MPVQGIGDSSQNALFVRVGFHGFLLFHILIADDLVTGFMVGVNMQVPGIHSQSSLRHTTK